MRNILIIGTGALGTLFAARLAGAGANVTMLGTWKAALETLNAVGVGLIRADGTRAQYPVKASDDPSAYGQVDLALVLVKAWQTERAARQLEKCLDMNGLAVTLQNGLGNREILATQLGTGRVALGVTTTGATLLEPGLARVGGDGLISLEAHPRSSEISDLLRGAGFQVEIVPDANALVWSKLVVNAAINPLTALLRVPNGVLLERRAARLLMAALARETAAVASAQGMRLPFGDPVALVESVARSTAANRSSMLQDVERGAPTEIDAICGAVARAGEACGVPTPVNWSMWQLISSLSAS